ncbi:hypothetical protein J8J14_04525 [Roseomonas sp. SSH11]|uniref:Uncharacterized protein n=1 Tax=Pararoseomonas baculiformis TaxID=2820812 RepID=A0ABS4AAK2_9PROT|nr:hypothetical protein [Pararoseomonas baculiformis]MBP0444035.1 hypothetical protein [Pararoseomonas baculiformis]
MYFEFGQALQAGLDCAGDITPDQGAVFGWVRHRAGEVLDLRVEGSPGEPVETLLLDIHPRRDVEAPEGMAVSGFSLVHDIPRHAAGRLLIIGASGEMLAGQEVAIDLLAYDLPVDVEAVTLNREWGASYQLLHGSARNPERVKTLEAEGGPPGIFRAWLDRLPRMSGRADWFMEFRRVSALRLPGGEIVVSGGFNLPHEPGERAATMGCALVRRRGGNLDVLPLIGERRAPLEAGFALVGVVDAPADAVVEAVIQIRRGEQSWWFRAEAAPGTLPEFLDALSLSGVDLPAADQGALHGWVRQALSDRGETLRAQLAAMALAATPAVPGGTALLFDINDDYASRVISLIAPQLEARFGRVILSGDMASRAAAGLMRRGHMEVSVEGGARAALEAAARDPGPVAPIDTASLVDAAIEGNPARLTANALPSDRLPMIVALHGMAGVGEMENTLRRVVALMGGTDPSALPMPTQRPDAVGGLVAEHLQGLWEMVPVSGTPR